MVMLTFFVFSRWISDHIEHCQATQPPPPPPPLIQNVTADAPPEPYHFFQSKSKIAQEEKSTVEVESLVNSEPKQESTNIRYGVLLCNRNVHIHVAVTGRKRTFV